VSRQILSSGPYNKTMLSLVRSFQLREVSYQLYKQIHLAVTIVFFWATRDIAVTYYNVE
jgi:hypothetical protein